MGWDWGPVNAVMERKKSRASSPVSASPPASERRRSSEPRRSLDVDGPTTPRPAIPASLMSSSPISHHSPRPSAMPSPLSKATGIVHSHDAADPTSSRTPIPKYPDSLRPSPSEARLAHSLPPPSPRQSVAMTPDSSAASTPHSTPTRAPGRRMTSNERTQRYTPSKSSPLRVSEPSLEEKKGTSHSSTTSGSWSESSPRAEMRSPAPSPHIDAGSLSHVASRSTEQVHLLLLKHVTGTAAQRQSLVSDSDHGRHSTGHTRNDSSVLPNLAHSAGLPKVQEDSLNTVTKARMKSPGSTQIRESMSSCTQASQAAVQRQVSDSLRSSAGIEQAMLELLPASSRGESKSTQTRQPKLRTPSRNIDPQNRYELAEEYSTAEEPEQTWSANPKAGAAAARTPKLQQFQPVPEPWSGARGESSYPLPLRSPVSTNKPRGRTSVVKWRAYCGLFLIFLFLFLVLPCSIPYIERSTESQAVSQVEGFLTAARNVPRPNSTNSTAAKLDLHAQICHIDNIRCNVVHHEPQTKPEFYHPMALRYHSDHFNPPCPAVGCLGRPTPALPTAIEEVVGDLLANVSSELLQLNGHFIDLERVLQDCVSQQEPLLQSLQAIVRDWERERSLFERCDRLLQRARVEEEEEQQEPEMSLSRTLHQATIQSCQLWMFAHKTAVMAGAAQELALSRWKTTKQELDVTMSKCTKDLQNNRLEIVATGERCRQVAREVDRRGLRGQLPNAAVEFLETKLTCSGVQLAREYSGRVSTALAKVAHQGRKLPERAPIAAPFHHWSPVRNGW